MRILLVEDDHDLASRLQQELSAAGYAVDHAHNGQDAASLLPLFEYELIILDLGLPDGDGLSLLRRWRQQGVSVPVLILTGRDQWYERVDGLKAGADDYMGKPFYTEELQARIQALLRQAHQESSALLKRGELLLDENTQSVVCAGRAVALTGSEYRLLHYLMLHTGQLVSKERLQEQLYDLDQDIASNVVEVYIRRLRQKIGPAYIQTRRGQGYLFVPPSPDHA
ncbi:MAG: response regulator [Candidatus Sericytochromatia bacterium]|nr:response regulator [Candidatus Sericytochromatia bacterium]